jgi:uncharacterized protein (TIGR03086 family)
MLDAMTEIERLTDLDRALAATEAVVAGISAGQWAAPTPCTELDARGVLNHLVRGNLLFVAIIRDEPRPVPGSDHLGTDPLAAFQQASMQLREAFRGPGVLEAVYEAPFGTAPGAALAHVRIVENLVHGWDLALATGQRTSFRTTSPDGPWAGPGTISRRGRRVRARRSPPRCRSRRTRQPWTGWPGSSAGRSDEIGHDEAMTSSFDSNPEDEYADDEYADYDAEDREQPSVPDEIPDDEPEADVLEQREAVPYDDDGDR